MFLYIGKDNSAEIFQPFDGLRVFGVGAVRRNTDQRAAGGLAAKRLQGDKSLLFPVVGRKGIPHLEPVKNSCKCESSQPKLS